MELNEITLDLVVVPLETSLLSASLFGHLALWKLSLCTLPPQIETICVTNGGASAGKPCIFPFKFNGATWYTGTWDQVKNYPIH